MGDTELMAVLMSVLVYETALACVRCVRAQRECETAGIFSPASLGLGIIIIILYYAIYGSTHKYKKAKIHLKYNLKYKNDMNTNIKAHSSARWATPHATEPRHLTNLHKPTLLLSY